MARPDDNNLQIRDDGFLGGARLTVIVILAIAALSLWLASMRGFDVEGVRLAIRFTARASLVLFCLVFSASALAALWPTQLTRWLLRNRRSLGLSFAGSHGIHAIAIGLFAAMAPADFHAATTSASFVFGGLGYAFIVAMAATSFKRSAAAIGPHAWRILHGTGAYYLWFQFMVSFGKRIPAMPNYVWFLLPLVLVMAIRAIAAVQARRARLTA